MKNPTFYQTVVASPEWQVWVEKNEREPKFDVNESMETGWLSPEHFAAFLEWVGAKKEETVREKLKGLGLSRQMKIAETDFALSQLRKGQPELTKEHITRILAFVEKKIAEGCEPPLDHDYYPRTLRELQAKTKEYEEMGQGNTFLADTHTTDEALDPEYNQ